MPAHCADTENMSANFNDLLEQGLEQAVVQQVCKLFSVLVTEPQGQEAMDRFVAGINKLAATEQCVAEYFSMPR